MRSIRNKLVITLSLSIAGLVFCILLAIDIAVDNWIDDEFDRSIQAKANMLMTLIQEDSEGIFFDFSSQYMTEFNSHIEPEYFQVWNKDKIVARSKSLDLFPQKNLPFKKLDIGTSQIQENPLPDGRDGRIIYIRFMPEVALNRQLAADKEYKKGKDDGLTLAYAASSEEVNFILWLIDIIFIITTISVIIFIRLFVRKAIDTALAPLSKLNEDIGQLSIVDKNARISIDEPIKELSPIVDSLNLFIEENRQLYLREKRLTSDISHEIKTPIAELINLTEVSIRFPAEKELAANFKPEVLQISLRLKKIVENLLILHKYHDGELPKKDACDLNQVIMRILEHSDVSSIEFHLAKDLPAIVSNLFALESIISNLVNNAKQYSPYDSKVIITTYSLKKSLVFSVTNPLCNPLDSSDLHQLFAPFWQKDAARSSRDNFGLGLSIAKTLSLAINANLEAAVENNTITFRLVLPVK
ncbi:ATP-binding protein [Alteromonas sp. C1M14]|uniref:sensor histidine kinase n=1 Tax=Alteromonas sp. C1M14 TaxID=2841567 RepID=UPI001C0A21F0|nr:ATP-binding protein [Alteromonas sp. C1M14]MBU2978196.1 HAMP domain-containing histidine kinase [Alteromonas sp. C1M14]